MNTETYELIETLEREFYSFDVPQLIAVVEELLEEMNGGTDIDTGFAPRNDCHCERSEAIQNVNNRRIFFEADPDLSFPPSDVGYVGINNDCADNGKPAATLRLPVMNLLGAASPLPAAFSDHITRGGANSGLYAGFLSIMQNRLHTLWIEAWRRNELWDPERSRRVRGLASEDSDLKNPERSRRAVSPTLREIFKFMTGLPIDNIGLFDSALPGLWLFSNRAKSAQGLKELLYAAFGDIPINIEENAGRYAAVSNAQPLGGAARLGRNAAAGARVYDETAKFVITIGPLGREAYMAFMPGGSDSRLIDEILTLYLNEPVICELAVTCRLRDLPKARLGGERPGGGALGRTAALGTRAGGGAAAYVKTPAYISSFAINTKKTKKNLRR